MYREKFIKKVKEYYKDNPERIKEASKQYRKNNPEKVKEWNRKSVYHKYKTDLKFNLKCKIRRAINHSLKGDKKGRNWETLVGYTLNELKRWLNNTMPEGYTWRDFLTGELQIDHIIPKSAFNYTKSEDFDFKRCWALSNLRLLTAKENLRKGKKIMKEFQLALKI